MLNSLKIENRMAKVKVRTRNQARSGYAIVRGQPRKRLRSSFSKSGTRNCVAAAALRGVAVGAESSELQRLGSCFWPRDILPGRH